MIGFKSFATKTKLVFEPGLTAIVGPNGCGKSNVADAVRWVIGEQSAKALRGSKMQDCIFNGTESRKALGMAEVSITFTDCEELLETEFHEITVTRRVFNSGEGQYFINRTPCRLKDIQRLFMDTGIGTSSYSLMEQGRIDRILSSRPEDRRAIFEEASGITKFKADKKEAIRKLEHTEANLLRLADVIREVKRQIGSLQRQAGKARRYKNFQQELRVLDLYVSRERLKEANAALQKLQVQISDAAKALERTRSEVEALEETTEAQREALMQTERTIGETLEKAGQARNRLERTRDTIRVSKQRIDEYRQWLERDHREIDESRRIIDERKAMLTALEGQVAEAATERDKAAAQLSACDTNFRTHQKQIDAARTQIQSLRQESVESESLLSKLQNQLVEIDARDRSNVIQRERLAAEKTQLESNLKAYETRKETMATALSESQRQTEAATSRRATLEGERTALATAIQALRQELAGLQSRAAASQAQADLLETRDEDTEGFPGGARALLDVTNPLGINASCVLGDLASKLDVEDGYARALEAAMRPWFDAIVVDSQDSAMGVLKALEADALGSVRLLEAVGSDAKPPSGDRLIDHVSCPEDVRPALERLIGHVLVVTSVEAIPDPVPTGRAYATPTGAYVDDRGRREFWAHEDQTADPLSRRNAYLAARRNLDAIEEEITAIRAKLEQQVAAEKDLQEQLQEARSTFDQRSRSLAQKEGELQILARETTEAAQRLETVTWELKELTEKGQTGDEEKKSIATRREELKEQSERLHKDIGERNRELRELENRHAGLQSELTEHRIEHARLQQKEEHLHGQGEASRARITEMESAVGGRTERIASYEDGIQKLTEEITGAESQLGEMEAAVKTHTALVEDLRNSRADQKHKVQTMQETLDKRRDALEALHDKKSDLDVRAAESTMRRDNLVERVTSEYNVTLHDVMDADEPESDGALPDLEALETRIAELRTKLEAMGPVNLVAIEEHTELEERFAFLTSQEQDLVQAKQQLMDMIRKINKTTSELFRTTFDKANENFQTMFTTLFNGGSAKLVLVNEEDVLDCGIEIIARPPGKKLQNVSLLSGGERTMTAVALLFAIYKIKPSPFCMLDELDAALDDANIGRFVKILKGFLEDSQFLVITHNRVTISAASSVYGVTMPERGVSSLVSMRFADHDAPAPPAEDAPGEPTTG